jgi:DNA-binding response OmpR family regulator
VERNEVKRQSVLLVEDEPCIALVCRRTLTAEGFQVDIRPYLPKPFASENLRAIVNMVLVAV